MRRLWHGCIWFCGVQRHDPDRQMTFGGTFFLTETFQSAGLVLVWRAIRSSQGWALVASKSKPKPMTFEPRFEVPECP